MEPPVGSPFFSPTLGVDKAAVVRRAIAGAGAWRSPATASRTSSPRGWFPPRSASREAISPAFSSDEGLSFHEFDRWSESPGCFVPCPRRAQTAPLTLGIEKKPCP